MSGAEFGRTAYTSAVKELIEKGYLVFNGTTDQKNEKYKFYDYSNKIEKEEMQDDIIIQNNIEEVEEIQKRLIKLW